MSAVTTVDQATRLARAMRLESMRIENVLINASAVPIPIDLMPTALAAPITDSNSAAGQALQDEGSSPSGQAQSHDASNGHIDQIVPADNNASATSHHESVPDAVLNGLQAARDAIHDSLGQDSGSPTQSSGADTHSSITADFTPQALHDTEALHATEALHSSEGLLSAAHGDLGTGDPLPAISAGNTTPLDIVAQVAQGLTALPAAPLGADLPAMNLDGQHAAALVPMTLVAQAADAVNDVAALVTGTAAAIIDPIHDPVQSIIPDAPQNVQSIAQNVQSVVQNVQGLAQDIVQDVVQGVAQHPLQDIVPTVQNVVQDVVPNIVPDVVQTVSSVASILLPGAADISPVVTDLVPAALAPLPAAIADAVTVPSLGGVGVDALAGLLQQPPLLAGAAPLLADPDPTSAHDIPSFAPIGLDHVTDVVDAGAAQAVHSTLHLVGTGLL